MSPNPKVCFITRKWPPAVGGMETYSRRLTEEMAKRAPVDIIALPGRASGRPPSALIFPAFALQVAAKLFFRPPSQVVHVGDLASWPLGWMAKVRSSRSKIVISAHGSDVSIAFRPGVMAGLYRMYLQLGAKLLRGASIIANSAYVADLSQRAGFHRVEVVPLATDLVSDGRPLRDGLLYVGRISLRKGLRFIVEEVLPKLPPEARLRVAGPVWQESERNLLAHPSVDYLGALTPDALAREYARAAAVLIPTRESEGFGLVAIEAAACGAYAIASDHSGLSDVVRPPVGNVVPTKNCDAWIDAIRVALARSVDEQIAHSNASKAWVDEHYRWPHVADATWAVYTRD